MSRIASVLATVTAAFVLAIPASAQSSPAKTADAQGIFLGYQGEWHHATYELLALAEATPAEKFAWRPAPGIRSTSEVYMYIAITNFWLLSLVGRPMPSDLKQDAERTVTSKPEVIAWLKRSLEAVRTARSKETPADLVHKVNVDGRDTTVDALYLRMLVHSNEHLGQLIAYARMTGVVPPWSAK
jgi:uncharacterized damage-inducible protein DinB